MDRKIIKGSFSSTSNIPPWSCPLCGSTLAVVKDTFKSEHSWDIDTSHPDFEPDWLSLTFTMLLMCTNTSCKACVACSGTGGAEQEYIDEFKGYGWGTYYQPKYFEPALKLFAIPLGTPGGVADELEQSFSTFFKYPSVSLVSLRRALEVLLTELGVESNSSQGGYLALGNRIKHLSEEYKPIIEPVTAIKWLGNDGAHGDKATIDDVLDGYNIFKHVLEELYPLKKISIKDTVDKIIAAKGIGK